MTPRILLLTLVACFIFISACKKEINTASSSDITVKYEVTWTAPLAAASISSFNQVGYTNSTGNVQYDNLLGNSYTKIVTLSNTAAISSVVATAVIVMQQAGTGEIKIYANDVLKSKQTLTATYAAANTYTLSLGCAWPLTR